MKELQFYSWMKLSDLPTFMQPLEEAAVQQLVPTDIIISCKKETWPETNFKCLKHCSARVPLINTLQPKRRISITPSVNKYELELNSLDEPVTSPTPDDNISMNGILHAIAYQIGASANYWARLESGRGAG
ncbi:hypothetical protein CEXT_792581 [Caerostris extrusa]|uniref:Uncharacterized protein n=1 Tax=Caerostris extrusa TaxID=172846 RepID=A0AAV4R1A4_CAEEX|nr:hypothetical protein CEXT_792581 [Caerostris extrusa]